MLGKLAQHCKSNIARENNNQINKKLFIYNTRLTEKTNVGDLYLS